MNELYHKTVNILLDAYNDDELRHGQCNKCAVGNICAEPAKQLGIYPGDWAKCFSTCAQTGKQSMDTSYQTANSLIQKTGYSLKELAYIEREFEQSIRHVTLSKEQYNVISTLYDGLSDERLSYLYYTQIDKKKGQYIGLCAVLNALGEIHNIDESESKERLTKAAEKKGVTC